MRSAEKKKGREEIYIFIFLFSPSLSLPISKRESSSNGMASNSNYNTMTGRYGVRTREHTAAAALVHSKSAVLCCWNKKGLKLLGLLHSNGLFVSLHTIIAVRHTEDVLPHLEGLLHVFLCLLVFFRQSLLWWWLTLSDPAGADSFKWSRNEWTQNNKKTWKLQKTEKRQMSLNSIIHDLRDNFSFPPVGRGFFSWWARVSSSKRKSLFPEWSGWEKRSREAKVNVDRRLRRILAPMCVIILWPFKISHFF